MVQDTLSINHLENKSEKNLLNLPQAKNHSQLNTLDLSHVHIRIDHEEFYFN